MFGFETDTIATGLIVAGAVMAVFLAWLGWKALRRPALSGREGMTDLTGVVTSGPSFRERWTVEVRGELWWCRSSHRLAPGMEVRVTGVDDMVLIVEPVEAK